MRSKTWRWATPEKTVLTHVYPTAELSALKRRLSVAMPEETVLAHMALKVRPLTTIRIWTVARRRQTRTVLQHPTLAASPVHREARESTVRLKRRRRVLLHLFLLLRLRLVSLLSKARLLFRRLEHAMGSSAAFVKRVGVANSDCRVAARPSGCGTEAEAEVSQALLDPRQLLRRLR
jgi:hypothetical protein